MLTALLALPGLAAAATHTVVIEDMKFHPTALTVKAGDKVVWHNKDIAPHTATAAGRFDSKNIAGGKSWSWTATGKGRHDYVCTYHLGMKATVTVE
ncbi:cupredoxin domain-containing protein [Ramlibacter sp. GTP1]|uniref:Cupredoxin domain-containing protein n=1 Tax=Ramlibacter albus TaxID=2079448 RepID=A0A923M921_9BURK|nr:plastocyanin/azurin family copper-binding protein [Ramlibacter albus]MBC5766053.1 cupredoxin domain-containing protein [Ramlibacter albus]